MLTVETAIDIAAAPDTVWAVLSDFARYGEWNPWHVKVEADGAALIVHSVHRPGMEPVAAPVVLMSAAFPEMIWDGGMPDRSEFRGEHHFRCERGAIGTHFRHWEHFSGTKAATLLDAHRATIKANFARFNIALKRAAEA